MTRSILGLAVAALVASPLQADPMATEAAAVGTDKSAFFPTGTDSGVMNFLIQFEPMTSGRADDPLAGASGPCWGLGTAAGGLSSGEGYCDFADPSGGHAVMHWSMEPTTEIRGSWQLVGGTGRWTGAAGGGYFYDTPAADGSGAVTHFVGLVQFD